MDGRLLNCGLLIIDDKLEMVFSSFVMIDSASLRHVACCLAASFSAACSARHLAFFSAAVNSRSLLSFFPFLDFLSLERFLDFLSLECFLDFLLLFFFFFLSDELELLDELELELELDEPFVFVSAEVSGTTGVPSWSGIFEEVEPV